MEFAFETSGMHKFDARAVVDRLGNGAETSQGPVKAWVLRRGLMRSGDIDWAPWLNVPDDWRRAKAVWGSIIH